MLSLQLPHAVGVEEVVEGDADHVLPIVTKVDLTAEKLKVK